MIGVQGQQHLNAVEAKLAEAFGIPVEFSPIPTALRETVCGGSLLRALQWMVTARHDEEPLGAGPEGGPTP